MSWKASVGVGVGVGVGAILAWWGWRKTHPCWHKWEEVGEVSELVIYPLKSGRGIKVNEAEATRYGLAHDLLEDRSFMVTPPQTEYHERLKVSKAGMTLTLEGSRVTLQATKELEELQFDLLDVIKAGKVIQIKDGMKGFDCGDEASEWLSQALGKTNQSVRLTYNGDLTCDRRPSGVASGKSANYARNYTYFYNQHLKPSDRVVYAEHTAYMLISETSLADLNDAWLERRVTLDWFRPNLVVRGVREPYDENDWAFVRIGDVVLRRVKPCTKKLFFQPRAKDADVFSMDMDDDGKLLAALATRSVYEPHDPLMVVFGVHLGIDTCGKIRVGDKVEVLRASRNPSWHWHY